MTTPAQRHRDRIRARAEQARARNNAPLDASNSLHLQLVSLEDDLKRLKLLARRADKVAMKRDELIGKYRPFVERYLEAGEVFKNPMFSQFIIWLFDVGELEEALKLADIAIEQGQQTPERIRRDWPHFVADEVLAWAEAQATAGNSVDPWFGRVFKKVVQEWRLNEQLTAKYYKFAGLWLLRDDSGIPRATAVNDVATLDQAFGLLTQAHNFHGKIGVQTMLAKIDQRIRALTETDS